MGTLFGREIDLLCLDMDDTLIATEAGAPRRFEDAARAIRRIRPEIDPGAIVEAATQGLSVDPNRGRLVNFLSDLGISDADEVQAVRDAYFESMPGGTELFDGVHEVLAMLRERFRLAIITNGSSALQREKVAHFDLDHRVDWIVVSGELGVDKPDPAIFEHVLGLAGVEAGRAAHVGDSLTSDIAGANRSGLLPIWVETHFPRDHGNGAEFTPAATIQHVRELLDA